MFTAVLFGMAGVQMLGKPDLVLEVINSENAWMWSLKSGYPLLWYLRWCLHVNTIIIHQTHYEKSDWSRAFNQFTIACELDMINAISAADIAFIMSSSTSAWLLSSLECSPRKQNG